MRRRAAAALLCALLAPVAEAAGVTAPHAQRPAVQPVAAAQGLAATDAAGQALRVASAPRVLTDDWGRRLLLPAPPARIVSLAPHATELLFDAGVGARVVAVDRSSDLPPQVRDLPALQAVPRPDIERLMALRPDLVIAWGAAFDPGMVERLDRLGIPVFISEPRSLDDIAFTLERFAQLAPDAARGQAAARGFRNAVASLRARHAQGTPVPVFVQIWGRPLMTLSDQDSFADVLRSCGARNLFGDEPVPAPQVGHETVLRRAPRLVLAFGADGQGASGDEVRATWTRLGLLTPKGSADFLRLDGAIHRPTLRLLAPMTRLCETVGAVRVRDRASER